MKRGSVWVFEKIEVLREIGRESEGSAEEYMIALSN